MRLFSIRNHGSLNPVTLRDDYLKKAREALARAQTCKDEGVRLGFLDLAEHYRSLAEIEEQRTKSEP